VGRHESGEDHSEEARERGGMMEKNNHDMCYFCKAPAEGFAMFNNIHDKIAWNLMPKNVGAHVDCYIQESIRVYLERMDAMNDRVD
jgi:hypothetical protein